MSPPIVLIHCLSEPDRRRLGDLIEELGAGHRHADASIGLAELIAGTPIDLAVADMDDQDDLAPLDQFLGHLETLDDEDDLPLIVVGRAESLAGFAGRVDGRKHVTLLSRPLERVALVAAIRSALALRARQTELRGLVIRLREANSELDRLRHEAEVDARRRIELLAAMSHNLRTPVNEILLSAQVLRSLDDEPNRPEDRQLLAEGLIAGASSLREIVDDLLDLARCDLGQVEYHPVSFPIAPFLTAALISIREAAIAKGLEFRIDCRPIHLCVQTDPGMLIRVVQNLVSNAVKFTETGSIVVEVRPGRDSVLLSVRDTGVGIAPEVLGRIFDEFFQMQNPERDRAKGTGLGLAICRRLALAMKGRIEVESEPRVGSRFTLILPAESA